MLKAPIAAIAASIGLIAVYLAFGGASFKPAPVNDPCQPRDVALTQERGLFEGIALSALDGAACDLQVTREQLTLALATQEATQQFAEQRGLAESDVEDAVRAGLVRAVDDQAAAGKVDGLEETALRAIAENAPVGTLIGALKSLPGDNSIQSLLGKLGSLQNLDLPGLPSVEELRSLLGG